MIFGCKDKEKKSSETDKPKTDTLKHLSDVVLENPEMDNMVTMAKRKRPIPPPPPPDVPPAQVIEACIFLDFDGHLTRGTMWNVNGDIISAPSGLSSLQQQEILDSVRSYYKQTPLMYVTSDSTIFFRYAIQKRMREVITATPIEFYGQVSGVSYINSFGWGTAAPCFVFSSLIGLSNTKIIADVCAHEAGHTLGCYHQSACVDGVVVSEYEWGDKIMGASYNSANPRFAIGTSTLGCSLQNDTLVINNSIRK